MINERLRDIRNHFDLNQRDFAKKIDVGASTLAMFETGQRLPKDIHIKRICSEFQVSEEWLRNGIGEMFPVLDIDQKIATYAGSLMNGETTEEKVLFVKWMETPEDEKKAVMNFLRKLSKAFDDED